jgi:hypothetical protein
MKKDSSVFFISSLLLLIGISISFTNCKKTENPIKFPMGTFPDTLVLLEDLNTAYDDYNTDIYQLTGGSSIIFSSNRQSKGGQFDLEQALITYIFDQTSGGFAFATQMTNDPFLSKLINAAKTPKNDFGPYRLYSSFDGYEYLVLSSVNAQGDLDFYYLKNRPVFSNSTLPDVLGPFPVKLFNTTSDDAYFSVDASQDSAYFCSSRNGDFDIFLHTKPAEVEFDKWFNQSYAASAKVDSVNTTSDDKCPMVFKKILIFTSNRPGGLGGYDLYYSVFRKGNWSSPVNLGPRINSASDEYRPIIGYSPDFTNNFLMFSSNRPGPDVKGGFDLYFSGYTFPTK